MYVRYQSECFLQTKIHLLNIPRSHGNILRTKVVETVFFIVFNLMSKNMIVATPIAYTSKSYFIYTSLQGIEYIKLELKTRKYSYYYTVSKIFCFKFWQKIIIFNTVSCLYKTIIFHMFM